MPNSLLNALSAFLFVLVQVIPVHAITVPGKVIDEKGQPVARAEVMVFEDLYGGDQRLARLEQLAPIVQTKADGSYEIPDVTIRSRLSTCIVVKKPGLALAWGRYDEGQIVLEKPAVISGWVVDEAGNPVPGASMRALPWNRLASRLGYVKIRPPVEWFSAQTDREGHFEFACLPKGTACDFVVKAPGWHGQYRFSPRLAGMGYEVGRTDIRLTLPEERTLTGKVVNQDTGDPVAGVALELFDTRSPRDRDLHVVGRLCPCKAVSDKHGLFLFAGVAIAPYKLSVQGGPQFDIIVHPEDRPATYVKLLVGQAGTLEFKAIDAVTQMPIEDLWVSAYMRGFRPWGRISTTDENGILRMQAPAGKVGVFAWKPLTGDRDYQLFQASEVATIETGKTTVQTLLIEPLPSVPSLFYDVNEMQVTDVLVRQVPQNWEVMTGIDRCSFAVRRPDDRPEKTVVLARCPAHGLAAAARLKDFANAGRMVLDKSGALTGRIVDDAGEPIPGASVHLAVHTSTPTINEVLVVAATDPSGLFTIPAVPALPGQFSYRLTATAPDYGTRISADIEPDGSYHGEFNLGPIELRRADRSISGFVLRHDGTPACGALVTAGKDQETVTDKAGYFRMSNLTAQADELKINHSNWKIDHANRRNVQICLRNPLDFREKDTKSAIASFVGQSIDDVPDVNVPGVLANCKGQRVCLCFWDICQPASRCLVKQLAKEKQFLDQQGIRVIAVEISAVDYSWWLKEQSIPFETAGLQQNAPNKDAPWDRAQLPQLVLGNPNHVVCWEGRTVGELKERAQLIGEVNSIPDESFLANPQAVVRYLVSKMKYLDFPVSGQGTARVTMSNNNALFDGQDLAVEFTFKGHRWQTDFYEAPGLRDTSKWIGRILGDEWEYATRSWKHQQRVGIDFRPEAFMQLSGRTFASWLQGMLSPECKITLSLDHKQLLHVTGQYSQKDYQYTVHLSFDTRQDLLPTRCAWKLYEDGDAEPCEAHFRMKWKRHASAWYIARVVCNAGPERPQVDVQVTAFSSAGTISDDEFTLDSVGRKQDCVPIDHEVGPYLGVVSEEAFDRWERTSADEHSARRR